MAEKRKKFWVRILWGAVPEDNEPCEYDFDTRAELNAFMDGVDQASGWLEYDVKAQVSDSKK
jgi:hypothetical protein